ncbi:DnaJ-like protein subfamily C member 9 [Nematocida homosporus]|uniref:DnaJ-like protein subfamily C member 9 n=1 Tax=Nematocida homosporus TaxID=1912981 RepID=UPI0022208176|nr:DnaJ-like protein subfamily C member 9 [Nematocida homosporus]KAI5185526.1 DnaJ-like protein subfamily C member 9 [Nematocida homosporus]
MKTKEAAEVLGCSVDASPEEIKKCFRRLAMKCHPDRPGGSEEGFMRLNQAYDLMRQKDKDQSNPITKNMFDRFRHIYEGSSEEQEEIISLYRKYKGSLAKIVDHMLLGEDEQEPRYRAILDPLITAGTLPQYPAYRRHLLTNKKRQEKRQKEAEMAAKLAQDLEARASNREDRWNAMIAKLEAQTTRKHK